MLLLTRIPEEFPPRYYPCVLARLRLAPMLSGPSFSPASHRRAPTLVTQITVTFFL